MICVVCLLGVVVCSLCLVLYIIYRWGRAGMESPGSTEACVMCVNQTSARQWGDALIRLQWSTRVIHRATGVGSPTREMLLKELVSMVSMYLGTHFQITIEFKSDIFLIGGGGQKSKNHMDNVIL